MSRVSEDELKVLIEVKPGEVVQPFIDDAETLIDETLDTNAFSAARLKLIEKYLAAHLWVISQEKGGFTSEKQGDATNTYAKYQGTGLASTRFGQQVIAFDTSGALDQVLSYTKTAQLRLA